MIHSSSNLVAGSNLSDKNKQLEQGRETTKNMAIYKHKKKKKGIFFSNNSAWLQFSQSVNSNQKHP